MDIFKQVLDEMSMARATGYETAHLSEPAFNPLKEVLEYYDPYGEAHQWGAFLQGYNDYMKERVND